MRELENVIEGAIALGTSTYIGRDELPLSVTLKAPEPAELRQWATELNACKNFKSEVPFAALHASDVIPVQVGKFRQILLRKSLSRSGVSDILRE